MFRLITFLLSLIFIQQIFTQTNDSTYLNFLLKDDNGPKRNYRVDMTKNILKTNVIQIFDGELQTTWEHRFNYKFGFDIGTGLIMPYSINKYSPLNSGYDGPPNIFLKSGDLFLFHNNEFENKKFGVSFLIEPKYYYYSKTLFLSRYYANSIGPFYRIRSYSNLLINEFGLAYTYIYAHRVALYTPSVAFSYTIQTPFNGESDLKYYGNALSKLNRHGLHDYISFRIYVRLLIGYVIN